jgi:biofilm PGA synthesis protein PgaA
VTPLGPEDQQDLFYAHIDNENFDAAKKQVDDLIKESPYLRRIYGSPTPQPNDNWLLGQSLLTQYHIAANELPEAEKLAEHLARTGSGNQGCAYPMPLCLKRVDCRMRRRKSLSWRK